MSKMVEEIKKESINGILTAMTHMLLFVKPSMFITELQNEKGRFVIFSKHSRYSWLKKLEIGTSYCFTELVPKYIDCEYRGVHLWETSLESTCFFLKMPIPFPKNLLSDPKMVNYKGTVTSIHSMTSMYELDGVLELCLTFIDMRSACPRLRVGHEVTVYNAHVAAGVRGRKCLVVCGKGFVRVHSEQLEEPFDHNVPLAIVVTRCKLGYIDFLRLRNFIPVFEEKFSNDFLHQLRIKDPQMFRSKIFLSLIKKVSNADNYKVSELLISEFISWPHHCIVTQKPSLELQMPTVKNCTGQADEKSSHGSGWSFYVVPNRSDLMGYLSVSGQTGRWMLSDASQALSCIIVDPNSNPTALQEMAGSIVLVRRYCVIVETFQVKDNFSEKKIYLYCNINDLCIVQRLHSYQKKDSTTVSKTELSSGASFSGQMHTLESEPNSYVSIRRKFPDLCNALDLKKENNTSSSGVYVQCENSNTNQGIRILTQDKYIVHSVHYQEQTIVFENEQTNGDSLYKKKWSSKRLFSQTTLKQNILISSSTVSDSYGHDQTSPLECESKSVTSTQNSPPTIPHNVNKVKQCEADPGTFHHEEKSTSINNTNSPKSCYSQIVLLHQKSSVMKESKNSPPQCCLLVTLVENSDQVVDDESPTNWNDAKRWVLVIKGPLLKQVPFLIIGYKYNLIFPPGFQFMNLSKTSAWTQKQCSLVQHMGAVLLPRGSQLALEQPCIPPLRCLQDVLSVSAVTEAAHLDIINVSGIIYDRLHINPKFGREMRSIDVVGFGVPDLKTIVLKLEDTNSCSSTICLYLNDWANHQYPLGMVNGAHICATFVKKFVFKSIYLVTTEMTNIEVLSFSDSPNINKCSKPVDKDFQCLLYKGQDLAMGDLVWIFMSPLVQSLTLKMVCSKCQSQVINNSCTYSGCFALDSSSFEASVVCLNKTLSGEMLIYFKNDHVRQILRIPESVWSRLTQIVNKGNEINFYHNRPKNERSESLPNQVLEHYCSIMHMHSCSYVKCRVMNTNSTGQNNVSKNWVSKLFCLEIKQPEEASAMLWDSLNT